MSEENFFHQLTVTPVKVDDQEYPQFHLDGLELKAVKEFEVHFSSGNNGTLLADIVVRLCVEYRGSIADLDPGARTRPTTDKGPYLK